MVWSKQRLMMLLRQTRPAELDLSVLRDERAGALETFVAGCVYSYWYSYS